MFSILFFLFLPSNLFFFFFIFLFLLQLFLEIFCEFTVLALQFIEKGLYLLVEAEDLVFLAFDIVLVFFLLSFKLGLRSLLIKFKQLILAF